MSTNYYATIDAAEPCAHCGHVPEPRRIHIGKSSAGWTFALHVEPDDPEHPSTWSEWLAFLARADVSIEDEYGLPCQLATFVDVVECRSSSRPSPAPEWMERNGAVPGPRGLVRRHLSVYTIGHGEDYYPNDGNGDWVCFGTLEQCRAVVSVINANGGEKDAIKAALSWLGDRAPDLSTPWATIIRCSDGVVVERYNEGEAYRSLTLAEEDDCLDQATVPTVPGCFPMGGE